MQSLPPITRNLLIANVVCFILQELAKAAGTDLTDIFGLHFVLAENFGIWQLVSYMFLHGGIAHLFFNMFSLWMFGGLIERTLGRNRFLLYYFICGVGAGLCQEAVQLSAYYTLGMHLYEYVDTSCGLMSTSAFLNLWTTIGASGACYGVLLAFGMLYPNERIMLLLPPIPMKAKYFVVGYAAIELFSAYFSNDNGVFHHTLTRGVTHGIGGTRKKQSQIVVNLCRGAHGGTRIFVSGFLPYRNHWAKPRNLVNIRAFEHAQHIARVRRKCFQISALSFGKNSVER